MQGAQGYIVGHPALPRTEPSARPTPVAVPADLAPREAEGPVGWYPTADGARALSLPSWTARTSSTRWLRDYARSIRLLAHALPQFAALTVTYRSGLSFFDQVAPVLLLARFFGVRTTLRYRSTKAETELEYYGRGALPFFRLCDRIEVSCGYLAGVFARFDLPASVIPDRVEAAGFPARRIDTVQPHIIMARRLVRGNGLTGAIRAFQLVKMKYPRAELTIAGDGSLRPWLEQFVRTERIFGITFTGQIDRTEIARLMAVSDIYLNNASIDTLPTSLLEAMASGLCVVTTPVGDIPRLIRDGRNGLLVPPNDFSALADRIIELVETPPLVAHLSRCAARSVSPLLAR